MVSPPPHSPLLLPHIELLVDAVRGSLPTHGAGVCVHNGESIAAIHAAAGMGSARYHHGRLRFCTPLRWRRRRNQHVSEDVSYMKF